jgi:chemotaxis signal transduction protein
LPVGLLADHVTHVRGIAKESVFPLPKALGTDAQRVFPGLFQHDHGMIPIIEPAGIFHDHSTTPTLALGHDDDDLPPVALQTNRLIEFSLGAPVHHQRPVHFGFSMAVGLELLDQITLVPIPMANANFAGVITWRGKPLAVLNLAERMGLTIDATLTPRVLVVKPPTQVAPLGLLVYPPIRVVPLPIPHRPCANPPAHHALIRGWFDLRDRILGVLDVQQLQTT